MKGDIRAQLAQPIRLAERLPAELQEHPLNEILTELRKSYHEAVAKIQSTQGEQRLAWEGVRNDAIRFLLQFAGDFFGTAEFHAWLRKG